MNGPHITAEQAARWVSGVLEEAEADALEAHAGGCPNCTALLQAEARVELSLQRATQAARLARPSRARRVAFPLLAAAAAALLGAFALRGRPAPPPAPPMPPSVSSSDRAFEVPRYEGSSEHLVLSAPATL